MKFSDFLIIYLACGAPLGVYYFFQNRKALHQNRLILNSFLTTSVWIPYAVRLLREFVSNKLFVYRLRLADKFAAVKKDKIDSIEKEIAQILLAENISVSLFDFRETFQRYAGLTLALQEAGEFETAENEKELFRIAKSENVNLGAKCLHRRNLNRLKFHQTLSRKDIVEMFGAINAELKTSEKFKRLVSEFFELLDDSGDVSLLEKHPKLPQTTKESAVRNTERNIWRTREGKPQSASQTALNLQAMPATATRKRE